MRYFLIFLLLPLHLFGQKKSPQTDPFSGIWTGNLYNDITRQNIHFELAINHSQGKYTGFTYARFEIEGKTNIGVKAVKIKEKKAVLFLEDDKLIENNYEEPRAKGVRVFMELHYSVKDTTQILSGLWKTNQTSKYSSVNGSIFLTKNNKVDETAIIPKLRQLGRLRQLSFMQEPLTLSKKDNTAKSAPFLQEHENSNANTEIVKIIPDTTIVNEEITIYMYPKGDDSTGVDKTKKGKPEAELVSVKDSLHLTTGDLTISPDEKVKIQKEILPVSNKRKNIAKKIDLLQNAANRPLIAVGENSTKPFLSSPSPVAAEKLAGREIETIRTVEIQRDSLVFSLFDNGSIDGDTVSVLLNGKVIMPRIGLLSRAVNKTIYLTPEMGDSITIILYAENLGSIPPNTGLLVVRDGEVNHEIRFSGDLKKNAAIILKRKSKIHEQ